MKIVFALVGASALSAVAFGGPAESIDIIGVLTEESNSFGPTNFSAPGETPPTGSGEVYRFRSLSFDLTVPASYETVFNSAVGIFGQAGSDLPRGAAPDDPGPWIRLVPEPGVMALLGLAGFTVMRRRR